MNHPGFQIRMLAFLGVLTIISFAQRVSAQIVYSLQRIPAGTVVVDAEADRWNRLILLARPVTTSGDIDRLPSGLQESVSRFSYTIMATVSKSRPVAAADPRARGSSASDSNQTANPRATSYQLAEVGIGYSTSVQGRQVIVTGAQAPADADLGFVDRQVLTQNESDLETARVVVRSSTLMMFDLVAIMARESGHREEPVRTLIWVDPQTGKSALATWVLSQRTDDGQSWTVGDDAMQVHSGGARLNNRLHVDESTFMLGIPTAKTFGLEHLLRGKQIKWTDKLRELAGKSSYSSETLAEFTAALNQAIRATQPRSALTQ